MSKTGDRSFSSDEVVRCFLDFFEKHDHLKIDAAPLVPKNDPTLLFINSGMAPLKDYFTGVATPPQPDLCNIQGCIRTTDIDDVGDRHHLTYFEMLGSWSIGHYWKDRAIELAYELLTEGFGFPAEKLYATVYSGDPELGVPPDEDSARIWETVGMPSDHIVPLGQDNFWGPAGTYGPCGPCTEVFFDTGDEYGEKYVPGGHFDDVNRYIEIWNAGVFMQYNKQPEGLEPLALKSVDTGSGLERLAMTLGGHYSVYETDAMAPIVQGVLDQMGASKDENDARTIADHLRSVAMLLAEGVAPSNQGAGYVVRRLIRRSVGIIAQRGLSGFSFPSVIDSIFDLAHDWQPQLKLDRKPVLDGFAREQADFERVLDDGLKRLRKLADESEGDLPGGDAFKLFATYGLPIDTVREYMRSQGRAVDESGFQESLQAHQEVSRGDKDDTAVVQGADLSATQFVGYEQLSADVVVEAIFRDGDPVESSDEGTQVLIVTGSTPFYAEGGGQVGDRGRLTGPDGLVVDVVDTKKEGGTFLHSGSVTAGTLRKGDRLEAAVDPERRSGARIHHSATHLLQSGLRRVLGPHAEQAGSLVTPEYLRFDVKHAEKITDEQLAEVEAFVNREIWKNTPSDTRVMPFDDAVAEGAIAMFGEKYGDEVRVVRFGEASMELCGGTHVSSTGEIGMLLIDSESSVAKGVRRIVALAGPAAYARVQELRETVRGAAALLKSSPADILPRLERALEKTPAAPKAVAAERPSIDSLRAGVMTTPAGTPVVAFKSDLDRKDMRDTASDLANAIEGVVCAMGLDGEKVPVTVAVAASVKDRLGAKDVFGAIGPLLEARGGGKPHLAEGGGKRPEGRDEVVARFAELVGGLE